MQQPDTSLFYVKVNTDYSNITLILQMLRDCYLYSIENALEAHNRTVTYMNNAQISLAYNGIFSSVETAAMGLGPILGVLGWKAVTAGIQWYKSYKVRKSQIYSLIDIFVLLSKGWFDLPFRVVHRNLSDI